MEKLGIDLQGYPWPEKLSTRLASQPSLLLYLWKWFHCFNLITTPSPICPSAFPASFQARINNLLHSLSNLFPGAYNQNRPAWVHICVNRDFDIVSFLKKKKKRVLCILFFIEEYIMENFFSSTDIALTQSFKGM